MAGPTDRNRFASAWGRVKMIRVFKPLFSDELGRDVQCAGIALTCIMLVFVAVEWYLT